MLPAQGVPAVAQLLARAAQGAGAACAGAEAAGAGAQAAAAAMQLHAHAAPQAAVPLQAGGAAGMQPGLTAGNLYAMTLAAQVSNGAAIPAAASLPAAGSGVLPGACRAKRGRPKGSKDTKPRKSRTPKPAKTQADPASPLNGQALEVDGASQEAMTASTMAQQPLAA